MAAPMIILNLRTRILIRSKVFIYFIFPNLFQKYCMGIWFIMFGYVLRIMR